MGELLDLTFYNPAQLSDDDFLAGFVARRDLLDKILDRLGRIKARGLAQHRLIVGQRGMGKTTLLRRVALGVRNDPSLSAVLLPLSFREEQYNVHNLHVFWCNCLDALGDWFEASDQADKALQIDADIGALESDDDEGTQAQELFERWMKVEGRRPLLLLDNLDIVLAGLKSEQWTLRRVLQRLGGIVVIGASATALEATATRDGAFYDFFQVDVLTRLAHHEVLLCLRHLARERGESGRAVLEVLDRDPARIHVLSDLTGGNPRTLVMLYLVLEASGDDDVMRDLERLLDQATPLYKARVEALAPQARVVFDAVALAWNPVMAAEIASTTGLEVNAVSTQLDRLFRDGVLEKVSLSSTSRTAFQVAERFFDIWYLMRHGPRRQRARLRWLTEMLRRIYTPRELRDRATGLLGRTGGDSTGNAAYCLALADAIDDSQLRSALWAYAGLSEEDALLLSAREQATFFGGREAGANTLTEWAAASVAPADVDVVERTYRRALEASPEDPGLWDALGRLFLFRATPRPAEARAAFEKASELEPRAARHWVGLGIALGLQSGHASEAENAFRQAIVCDSDHFAAWGGLGMLLSFLPGRCAEAEVALRRAIEINPDRVSLWAQLGRLLASLPERFSEAEEALYRMVEIDPGDARAWGMLGQLLARSPERQPEAEVALVKAVELDPAVPTWWNSLGNYLFDSTSRITEAESAFRESLRVDPKNAHAVTSLAYLLLGQPARRTDGESAYEAAVSALPPHGAGVLRAFHALCENNFGTATTELQAVLEEGHPDLFTNFRDDLLRVLRFAETRGYGDQLLEWLTTSGLRDRYWPLWAAFDAYLHGEERLSDVNPEVRTGAQLLLAELKPRVSATEAGAIPRRPRARSGRKPRRDPRKK